MERAHALRATLAGCDRATRLVEQLLMLSRLEDGAAHHFGPLDLAALTQRVAAELAVSVRWPEMGTPPVAST